MLKIVYGTNNIEVLQVILIVLKKEFKYIGHNILW